MFETESAKYADEHCGKCCTENEYRLCKVNFQRGAEFGYAEANRWYKPSKKLPKECTLVLAYGFDDKDPSVYYYVGPDTWEWTPRRIAVLDNSQIRLWKEIILPEDNLNGQNDNKRIG